MPLLLYTLYQHMCLGIRESEVDILFCTSCHAHPEFIRVRTLAVQPARKTSEPISGIRRFAERPIVLLLNHFGYKSVSPPRSMVREPTQLRSRYFKPRSRLSPGNVNTVHASKNTMMPCICMFYLCKSPALVDSLVSNLRTPRS